MPNEINPASERPFFLVGCPRSGTTLLQRLLDAHGALGVAAETFFIRRFWLRRRSYGDLRRDRNLDRLVDDVVTMPEFAEMELDAAAYRRAARATPRTYAALFGLLLEQYRERTGAERIGEKTPNHLLYLDTLQRFFPAARFIHIVRDARAVVNSWRTVPWSHGIRADAEVWRRYLAAGRRASRNLASAMLTIRYEALVDDPERPLRELCRFLEVDFDPQMLAHHRQPSRAVNLPREPWKERSSEPVSPEPATRWRRELAPREIARIEAVAGREMRRWGYEPATRASALSPTALLAAAGRAGRAVARPPLVLGREAGRMLMRPWSGGGRDRNAPRGAAEGRGGDQQA